MRTSHAPSTNNQNIHANKLCVSIIGSSDIVLQHLEVLKYRNITLLGITSTNKDSIRLNRIAKKYKIKKFYDYKTLVKFSAGFKNHFFLIAPRVNDTYKILSYILKYSKSKILVEKPISYKSIIIKKLLKFHKRIFVGYNRTDYKSIKYLKKQNFSRTFTLCVCPEKSLLHIKHNSSHIISILIFIFTKLKILSIKKKNNFIDVSLSGFKNNQIRIVFAFNTSENFSIKTYQQNKTFLLEPIENLCVFQSFEKKKNKGDTIFKKKLIYNINEYKLSKFKPGFYEQFLNFEKFLFKNQLKKNHDIKNAYEIMKITESISNYRHSKS